MNKTTDLWNKVKEEVNAMSIEQIREFLDVKENRRGYFGSMGKSGIGDYYCIPIDVLIKCGEIASSLNHDEWCTQCAWEAEGL